MYFTLKRPFWNTTPQSGREIYALCEKNVTIYPDEHYYAEQKNLKLDKLYAGTPEDRILIWERK